MDTDGPVRGGKKRKGTEKHFDSEWKGFVDFNLTDGDRVDIEEFFPEGAVDVMNFISMYVTEGHKFSVSSDPAHDCFIATMSGKHKTCENYGYAVSARGPDVQTAVIVLWYKLEVLAHGGQWVEEGKVASRQQPLFG